VGQSVGHPTYLPVYDIGLTSSHSLLLFNNNDLFSTMLSVVLDASFKQK